MSHDNIYTGSGSYQKTVQCKINHQIETD